MPRRHDIDALRVIAFGLLILYHVGMVYVVDWGFHIKSAHQAEWLQWPMIALNRWRMPLLFMISGIALGLAMASRSSLGLIASRSGRLLLPLGFGMLAIVPVQAYCEAVLNGAIEPGFAAFMRRYLQLRAWPDGGWAGAEYGVTWNHLWYLAYVWCYSLLVLIAAPLLSSAPVLKIRDRVFASRGMARVAIWGLLPALWGFACLWWWMPRFEETHALWGDWFAHAKYGGFFLIGWLVAREARFFDVARERRWPLLAVALLAIGIELSLRAAGRDLPASDIPAWALQVNWAMIERGARAAYAWVALLAIFGWAARWLDRPFPWLPYARDAVYPCYILHQSLIVLAAYWLIPLGLGPVWEPLGVLAITVAGCAAGYGAIRRVAWLRPLFGLPARMPDRTQGAGPMTRQTSTGQSPKTN